jgi:hypothetical protein
MVRLNVGLTKIQLFPEQFFKSSHKKFIFNCETCSKEFTIRLDNITNSGNWCNPCISMKKNGYGPEPIFINGIETMPMSNKSYTILYKAYISAKNKT